MATYLKVNCACGRKIGENVFKQHARKCFWQLQVWATEGRVIHLLDERSSENKLKYPII
jgi:hypothetical protein